MNTIFLIGAIHGLVLALLLASKKINRLSNRILGSLMVVFSVDLLMAAFIGSGFYQVYPHFIGIDFPITVLYGPLLYLYTTSLIKSSSRLDTKDWLHFLPFVLLLVYTIPFYTYSGAEKINLLADEGSLEYGSDLLTHFKVGFSVAYVPFIIRALRTYRKQVKDNFSSFEKRNLDWLQFFVLGGVLMAVIATGLYLMDIFSDIETDYGYLTLLTVTIFVYSIGYLGLRQPEFFANFEKYAEAQEKGSKKYSKSGLDDQTGKILARKLKDLMEGEQPYLNNELNLFELATMMDISPHNLTEIINKYADKNFYDFINAYRVEEVKRRIQDPSSGNFTLLAIGLEAGFNSKSSFNSVFKKHTGMTPSEFKLSH